MLQYKSVNPVGLRQGYLKIPSFVEYALPWYGSPIVFRQYNYSAPTQFTLPYIPKQPEPHNYALCIKYRVGNKVYRYRLWDKKNSLDHVNWYSNEVIKPNFCLEFWGQEGINEIINPEIVLPIGIRQVPSDLRNASGFIATTDPQLANLSVEIMREIQTTGLVFWYIGDDVDDEGINKPDKWSPHNSYGVDLIPFGVPFFKDTFHKPSTRFSTATLSNSNQYLSSQSTPYNIHELFLVFSFPPQVQNGLLLLCDAGSHKLDIGYFGYVQVQWDGLVMELGDNDSNSLFTDNGQFYILALRADRVEVTQGHYNYWRRGYLYTADGTLVDSAEGYTNDVLFSAPISLRGSTYPNSYTSYAEVIGYNVAGMSDQAFDNIVQYLVQRYHKGIHLNTPTFHPSAYWLDNPEPVTDVKLSGSDVKIEAPDIFKEVLYLRNVDDGKYYAITLKTVNGQTSIQLGSTPYEPK